MRAYKTEINPTAEQKQKIHQTIGVCRFVYNFYIAHNKDVYEKQKRFVSGMDFSKWLNNDGVGIDLGIKNLAVVSNTEKPFKNINKTEKVKELEKKLKREQRKLSRKYESLKVRNKRKGGNATRQNIQKQIVKVQKLHNTLTNIRDNYINQVVNEIVKTKPSYISIEDLNVSGMMKNKHLARVIAQQKFYQFKIKLQYKCKLNGIELRIVDRYYPSSKMCNECGSIDKTLNLSDRIYICKECGCVIDRDKNASINLANAKTYKVA